MTSMTLRLPDAVVSRLDKHAMIVGKSRNQTIVDAIVDFLVSDKRTELENDARDREQALKNAR